MKKSVFLMILGVISIGVGVACHTSWNWQKAEEAARNTAKNFPDSTGNVECTHTDSDGDGYCSCTIYMKDNAPPMQFDCGCPKVEPGAGCMQDQATGCKPYNQFKGTFPKDRS